MTSCVVHYVCGFCSNNLREWTCLSLYTLTLCTSSSFNMTQCHVIMKTCGRVVRWRVWPCFVQIPVPSGCFVSPYPRWGLSQCKIAHALVSVTSTCVWYFKRLYLSSVRYLVRWFLFPQRKRVETSVSVSHRN